jgi:N-acetylmuramoyl-L-alanine amidase
LSSATKLNASDKRLKHLDNIDFYVDKETYKYTYGSTPSWEEALQMLKTAKKHYPEAFIITTVNGKRI